MYKEPIYLFTVHHTGTHFVRMLLETHPEISVCVDLARRISAHLDPTYVIENRAWKTEYNPNEITLREAFIRVCRGSPISYFRDCFACYMNGYMMKTPGTPFQMNNGAQLMQDRRQEFRQDHQIELPRKVCPRYFFFHGHCDLGFENLKVPQGIRIITTIRNPLLAILSSLKRGESDAIPHQMFAFKYVQEIPNAFRFCVDLWDGRRDALLSVFNWLGLSPSDAAITFASASPKVNRTLSPDALKPHHNYEIRRNLDSALDDARSMLLEGRLHRVLRPYWKELRAKGVLPIYEALGYSFDGLDS